MIGAATLRHICGALLRESRPPRPGKPGPRPWSWRPLPDAVRLRRWDEAAKDPEGPVPAFTHFRPQLAALLRPSADAA